MACPTVHHSRKGPDASDVLAGQLLAGVLIDQVV